MPFFTIFSVKKRILLEWVFELSLGLYESVLEYESVLDESIV